MAHVYYCDFGLVMCMGGRRPVDGIYKIIVDSEIVWKNDAGVLRGSAEFEDITVDKHGQARIYWGSETQPIDPLVFTIRGVIPVDPSFDARDKSTWTRDDSPGVSDPLYGHYDLHSAYRGQCYVVFKKWKLGRERGNIPNIQVELMRGVPWFAASAQNRDSLGFNSDARGVNPAGVLFDWFTDARFGRAFPEAGLVRAKWEATAQAISGLRISPLITSQEEFRTSVAKVLEYFDGYLRNNGGLLELGYFSHGAINLGALPQMTDDDLVGDPDIKPSTYSDAFTRLTLSILDRNHYYQQRPGGIYNNPAMRRTIGQPMPAWLDRTWITDPDIGKLVAIEDGHMRSLPSQKGTLPVKREWLDNAKNVSGAVLGALPGDRFMWNSASKGFSFCLRLNKLKRLKDSSGEAELTVENERSVWPTRYIPPSQADGGDFHVSAEPITNAIIVSLPYGLRDDTAKIELAVLAQRPRVEMQRFNVWFSPDGVTYNLISGHNQFGVYGTLAYDYPVTSGIYDTTGGGMQAYLYGPGLEEIVSQTPAQRENNNLLAFVGYQFGPFILYQPEIMAIGGISVFGGGLFRFTFHKRGRYGTPITFHPGPTSTGGPASVWLVFRSRLTTLWDLNFFPSVTSYFKLQTYTAIDEVDIADAQDMSAIYAGPPSVGLPVVSPGTESFSGTLVLSVFAELGETIRYSLDGSPVTIVSPEWPKSGGAYTTMAITQSCTLRVRGFFADGTTTPEVGPYIYTQVAAGSAGTSVAGPVRFQFSGSQGQSGGSLTIIGPASSSTVHYSKNGGAFATYTAPITLVLGDIVDAYESAGGLGNSPVSRFNNTAIGGGYDPAAGGSIGGGRPVYQQ